MHKQINMTNIKKYNGYKRHCEVSQVKAQYIWLLLAIELTILRYMGNIHIIVKELDIANCIV